MEGQSEGRFLTDKGRKAPTAARLTKQVWRIRVEDLLYFKYGIEAVKVAPLASEAFAAWGDLEPQEAARRIIQGLIKIGERVDT